MVLYAEPVLTFYELSLPLFTFFIPCLIVLTSTSNFKQKTATFILKKCHCSLGRLVSQCNPELRSEILPRCLHSTPLWQLWWLCTRLRAAHWRTLGNEAQLGLTGKDTGWHNSPIPPSPCQQGSLSFYPFSFHLPVWQVCLVRPNPDLVKMSW